MRLNLKEKGKKRERDLFPMLLSLPLEGLVWGFLFLKSILSLLSQEAVPNRKKHNIRSTEELQLVTVTMAPRKKGVRQGNSLGSAPVANHWGIMKTATTT